MRECPHQVFVYHIQVAGEAIRVRAVDCYLVLDIKLIQVILRDEAHAVEACGPAHLHDHRAVELLLIADKGGDKVLEGGIDILDQWGMLQQVLYDLHERPDDHRRAQEAYQRDERYKNDDPDTGKAEMQEALKEWFGIAVKEVKYLIDGPEGEERRTHQQQALQEIGAHAPTQILSFLPQVCDAGHICCKGTSKQMPRKFFPAFSVSLEG